MNSIFLFFSEKVSTPVISWNCINKTLTCEVTRGTDLKLRLYYNGRSVGEGQKVITHKWNANSNGSFTCTANNDVSEETKTAVIECPGAWQALVRHPQFTSQTRRARPTAEAGATAWVPGLGGSLDSKWELKTCLPHPPKPSRGAQGSEEVVFWHYLSQSSSHRARHNLRPLKRSGRKNCQTEDVEEATETISCNAPFPERQTHLPKVPQLVSDYQGDSPGNDGEGGEKHIYSFLEGRWPAMPIRDQSRRAVGKQHGITRVGRAWGQGGPGTLWGSTPPNLGASTRKSWNSKALSSFLSPQHDVAPRSEFWEAAYCSAQFWGPEAWTSRLGLSRCSGMTSASWSTKKMTPWSPRVYSSDALWLSFQCCLVHLPEGQLSTKIVIWPDVLSFNSNYGGSVTLRLGPRLKWNQK